MRIPSIQFARWLLSSSQEELFQATETARVLIGRGPGGTGQFQLEVEGDVGPSADNAYGLGSQSYRYSDLWLGPDSLHLYSTPAETGSAFDWTWQIRTSGDVGNLLLHESGTQRMDITPTGDIGIGTSTPEARLHVIGNAIADDPISPDHLVTLRFSQSVLSNISWQEPVISRSLSTPPASPNDGDRYVVAGENGDATATGTWAGEEERIAQWDNANIQWNFFTPNEGWVLWIEDEDVQYLYNADYPGGMWVKFGTTITHANLIGLGADDHLQYFRHDGTREMTGSIIPDLDNVHDIGSPSRRFNSGYFGPSSLHVHSAASETGVARQFSLDIEEASGPTQGFLRLLDELGSTELMTWDVVSQRVGINQPAPTQALDVTGTINLTGELHQDNGQRMDAAGRFRALGASAAAPGYHFIGDESTGFFRVAAGVLGWSLSGTEEMRLSNVGLGVGIDPVAKLHVHGSGDADSSLRISRTSGVAGYLEMSGLDEFNLRTVSDAAPIRIGNDWIFASTTGQVGIGTSTIPAGPKLYVADAVDGVVSATLRNTFLGAGFQDVEFNLQSENFRRIRFLTDGGVVRGQISHDFSSGLSFDTDGTTRLRIGQTDGLVSVGTTTLDGQVRIVTGDATRSALNVDGASLQSANLQSWRDSAATPLAHVGPLGRIRAAAGSGTLPGFAFQGDDSSGMYLPSPGVIAFVTNGDPEWQINTVGHFQSTHGGRILTGSGSAATPGYTFAADPDSGLRTRGTNELGWSLGGVEKMYLDAAGLSVIGGLSASGHFLPSADNTYDLGENTTPLRWRAGYFGPGSLHVSSTAGETTTARDYNFHIEETAGSEQGFFRIREGTTDLITVTPGGSVGIGSPNPGSNKVYINHTSSTNNPLSLRNLTPGGPTGITMRSSGGTLIATMGMDDDNHVMLHGSAAGTSVKLRTAGTTGFYMEHGTNNISLAGDEAPTHTLTFPSVSTGVALYNTADQVTNYERGLLEWSGDTLFLRADSGGTGVSRSLHLGTDGTQLRIAPGGPLRLFGMSAIGGASAGQTISLFGNITAQNAASVQVGAGNPLTASSGEQQIARVYGTINQTSTAGYTGLFLDVTEASVGTGVADLIDAHVGGVSQFRVNNIGGIHIPNTGYIDGAGSWELKRLGSTIATVEQTGFQMEHGNAAIGWGPAGQTAIKVHQTNEQFMFMVGTASGNQFVFGHISGTNRDFGHAATAYPTLYIHSATDPNTDATQWGSLYQDTANFIVNSNIGSLNLQTQGATRIEAANGGVNIRPDGINDAARFSGTNERVSLANTRIWRLSSEIGGSSWMLNTWDTNSAQIKSRSGTSQTPSLTLGTANATFSKTITFGWNHVGGATPRSLWGNTNTFAAATHAITMEATAEGYAHYNTADHITDYERGVLHWDTDEFVLRTQAGGFGTLRNLKLGAPIVYTTDRLHIPDGTTVDPSFAFTSDPDTGLRLASAGNLGFVLGGVTHWQMSPNLVAANGGLLRSGNGTVSTPTHSFFLDNDTGAYRIAADTYGLSTAGVEAMRINPTQQVIIGGSSPVDSALLTVVGTISGQTPTADSHLVTKSYVDTVVANIDWQESVLDRDLATPPVSPTTGDRYIVAATATGDWTGQEDSIAEWNGASWDFYAPNEGWATFVEDENTQVTYNGTAWVTTSSTIDHGALIGLGDVDDHPDYVLLDGTRGMIGPLVPSADLGTDLGTPSLRFNDLHLGPASLHIESTAGETGTAHDWNIGIDTVTNQGRLQIGEGGTTYAEVDSGYVAVQPDGVTPSFLATGPNTTYLAGTKIYRLGGNIGGSSWLFSAEGNSPLVKPRTGNFSFGIGTYNATFTGTIGFGFNSLDGTDPRSIYGVTNNFASDATHAITMRSTTNGIALYNTADHVTDYERGVIDWDTDKLSIRAEAGGTGIGRVLELVSSDYTRIGGFLGVGSANTPVARLQIGDLGVAVPDNKLFFGKTVSTTESNAPRIHHMSSDGAGNDLGIGVASGSGALRFFTGNLGVNQTDPFGTGSNVERVRIHPGGTVAIGEVATVDAGSRLFIAHDFSTATNHGVVIKNSGAAGDGRPLQGVDSADTEIWHMTEAGRLRVGAGTEALPAVSSLADLDTGIYFPSPGTIRMVNNGQASWTFNASSSLFAASDPGARVQTGFGSLSLVGYGFNNDGDTGLYRATANTLGFVSGAVETARATDSLWTFNVPVDMPSVTTGGLIADNLATGRYLESPFGGLGRYENLLGYSEEMGNAAWVATNTSVGPASVDGPDEQSTANELAMLAGTSNVRQTVASGSVSSRQFIYSAWVRSATPETVRITIGHSSTPVLASVTVNTTTEWTRVYVDSGVIGATADTDIIVGWDNANDSAAHTIEVFGNQLVEDDKLNVYVRSFATPVTEAHGLVSNVDGTERFGGSLTINAGSAIASGIEPALTLGGYPATGTGQSIDFNVAATVGNVNIGAQIVAIREASGGAASLGFYTKSASTPNRRMYISSIGSVGIGSSDPDVVGLGADNRALTVSRTGSNGSASLELEGNKTTDLDFGTIHFINNGNHNATIAATRDGADNTGKLTFHTANAGALSEAMVITPEGFIGIGAPDPNRPLYVSHSSSTSSGVTLRNTTSGGPAGTTFFNHLSQNSGFVGIFQNNHLRVAAANGFATKLMTGGATALYVDPTTQDISLDGNEAPTHTLTLPSTASGIALYNTADQVTDYERVVFDWASDIFSIRSEAGGTGVERTVRIDGAAGYVNFGSQEVHLVGARTRYGSSTHANSGVYSLRSSIHGIQLTGNITSQLDTAAALIGSYGSFTGSSGDQYNAIVDLSVNQTSTAAYHALLVDVRETAIGTGASTLIDARIDDVAKFSVRRSGVVDITSSLVQNGSTRIDAAGRIRAVSGSAGDAGFQFVGAAGTGLFLNGTDTLGLTSAGVARWNVNASGHFVPEADVTYDIGISSTNRVRDLYLGPSSLHIQSTAAETTTARDYSTIIETTAGSEEGNLKYQVGGSPYMTVAPTGHVGINHSNPGSQGGSIFIVRNVNSGAMTMRLRNDAGAGSPTGIEYMASSSNTVDAAIGTFNDHLRLNAVSGKHIKLLTQSNTRMFIDNASGDVAIGGLETGITAKLHVTESATGEQALLRLHNQSTAIGDDVAMIMSPANLAGAKIVAEAPGSSDVELSFHTVNSGVQGEALRLNDVGQLLATAGTVAAPGVSFIDDSTVGLRQVSGNLRFVVAGADRWTITGGGSLVVSNANSRLLNNPGSEAAPSYGFSGNASLGMWSPGTDILAFSSSSTEALRINSTQDVMIGTTAPTDAAKLTVNGTVSHSTPTAGSHSATKDYVDSLINGLEWQDSVIAIQSTPPVSPAVGDRYIVDGEQGDATATGAWAGQEEYIAEWNGSSWDFTQPTKYMSVLVDSLDAQYNYNDDFSVGSWVQFISSVDHGGLGGLLDDDHPQYLLISGARGMTGDLVPDTDLGASLGTNLLRWNDVIVGPSSLRVQSTAGETTTARDYSLQIETTAGAEQGHLRILEGASDLMTITPLGRVGLGSVTDPASTLDVGGLAQATQLGVGQSNAQLTVNFGATAVRTTPASASHHSLIVRGAASQTQDILFVTDDATSARYLIVDSGGNVGVNVTTPGARFDLTQDVATAPAAQISHDVASPTTAAMTLTRTGALASPTEATAGLVITDNDGNYPFIVKNSNWRHITTEPAGQVGLGMPTAATMTTSHQVVVGGNNQIGGDVYDTSFVDFDDATTIGANNNVILTPGAFAGGINFAGPETDTLGDAGVIGIGFNPGIGVPADLRALAFADTHKSGITIYNTADRDTNYESARFGWNGSNELLLETVAGGTGVGRDLVVGAGGAAGRGLRFQQNGIEFTGGSGQITLSQESTNTRLAFQSVVTTSVNPAFVFLTAGSTFSSSGNQQRFFELQPDINQSGTAGYTALNIDVTENSLGTGTNNLIDAKIGGVSQFSVSNTGDMVSSGGVISGGLSVGHTGSPVDDTVSVGAAAFRMNYNAGTPRLEFDTDDYFQLSGSNTYDVFIGGVQKLQVGTDGTIIPNALGVGSSAVALAANTLAVGDDNFLMDHNGGTQPQLFFDSTDRIEYTRSGNYWDFTIAGTDEVRIGTTGLQVANGLNVGVAIGTSPADDIINIGDTSFNLDFNSGLFPRLQYDNLDYISFERASDTYSHVIAGSSIMGVTSTGVGVGTTTPSNKFHVLEDSGANVTGIVEATGGSEQRSHVIANAPDSNGRGILKAAGGHAGFGNTQTGFIIGGGASWLELTGDAAGVNPRTWYLANQPGGSNPHLVLDVVDDGSGGQRAVASWDGLTGFMGLGIRAPQTLLNLASNNSIAINLPSPTGVGTTLQAGSQTGTFYYAVTALGEAGGETIASAEVSASPSAQDVNISWTGVGGAVEYRVYKGTSSGSYSEYFTVVSPTTSYLDNGAAGTAYGPASGPANTTAYKEKIGGSPSWFMDGIGAGTTNPGSSPISIVTSDATGLSWNPTLELHRNNTFAPGFDYYKSRGSKNSPLTVTPGDGVGWFAFRAWNGTAYRHAARIRASVDPNGTVTGSSMPGELKFYTTPDGSNFTQERLRIAHNGNIGIGLTTFPQTRLNLVDSSTIAINMPAPSGVTAGLQPGSLSGTFYYVVTTLDNAGGETIASAEVSASPLSEDVVISWSPVTNAIEYRVYKGTSSGSYTEYFTVTHASGLFQYVDNGVAGTAGSPPSVTTAYSVKLGGSPSWVSDQLKISQSTDAVGLAFIEDDDTGIGGSALTASGNAFSMFTGGVERMFFSFNGRVALASNFSSHALELPAANLDIMAETTALQATRFGANTNINLRRATDNAGSPDLVVDGEDTGIIGFLGHDGSGYKYTGQIRSAVDGTASLGDVPGRLEFHTAAAGAGSAAETMRLTSEGKLGLGTTDPLLGVQDTGTAGRPYSAPATGVVTPDGTGWFFMHPASNHALIWNGGSDLRFGYDDGTIGGSFTEAARLTATGRMAVGTAAPDAPLHVRQRTEPGGTAGDFIEVFRLQAETNTNEMYKTEYAYRAVTGTGWNEVHWHDSIGVDASFLTPRTDSRCWWERDPNSQIQMWGSNTIESMRLSTTQLKVGSAATGNSRAGTLHVASSANSSGLTTTSSADDLVLETSGHTGMTILSGNTSLGRVNFADNNDSLVTMMQYDHNSNVIDWYINNGFRAEWSNTLFDFFNIVRAPRLRPDTSLTTATSTTVYDYHQHNAITMQVAISSSGAVNSGHWNVSSVTQVTTGVFDIVRDYSPESSFSTTVTVATGRESTVSTVGLIVNAEYYTSTASIRCRTHNHAGTHVNDEFCVQTVGS